MSSGGSQGNANAEAYAALANRIGVELDVLILEHALTHRSFAYENGGLPTNERLEFLGDCVLGLVVTDTLFRENLDLPEGQLAKMRSSIVNTQSLAEVARQIGLGEFIRLGRGEVTTGGSDKSSILADTMEAVIGAVYLARDLEAAAALVHRLFDPLIDRAGDLGAGLDWKTSLQELTASNGMGVPEYVVTEQGPDHSKSFEAQVRLGDSLYGRGTGKSKKAAEQQAAQTSWEELAGPSDAGTS